MPTLMPAVVPTVFTTDDAYRAGYTPADVRRHVRQGRWIPLRRGVFVSVTTWERVAGSPRDRHLLEVHAGQRARSGPTWASHASAVRVHDLPTPVAATAPDRVELTDPAASCHRRYDGLTVHAAALPDSDRAVVAGVPVTGVARTVVDVGRQWPFADALAVADAALHRISATAEDLAAVAEAGAGWPGILRACSVLRHADGRRASPLESWSWSFFLDRALPLPALQVRVGNDIADFGWLEEGVLGEADGQDKYGEDEVTRRRTFIAEKRRQERLEDAGFIVVRWGYADLLRPDHLAARILAALARGSARRRHGG